MPTSKRAYIIAGATGLCLLAGGLALQLVAGSPDPGLTAWPVNIIALAALVAATAAMHALRRRVALFAALASGPGAVCAICGTLVVTVALGLTPQAPAGDADTPWTARLTTSWPFMMMYLWLTLSLGLAVAGAVCRRWNRRTLPFLLNHLGLWTVLVTATLGAADRQELDMTVGRASLGFPPQWTAIDRTTPMHRVVQPGLGIELLDFDIEYYDAADAGGSGSAMPRSYTSRVRVYTRAGREAALRADTVIRVNAPLQIDGWKIYQYGYDGAPGPEVRYTELRLVRDPWLPWVYAGILMMLAGAVSLLFTTRVKQSGT